MRINKYLALHTSLSRRKADDAIFEKRVKVNGEIVTAGYLVDINDIVLLDDVPVRDGEEHDNIVILLNKPVGYVCSTKGQGSKTIYDLLPKEYKNLKPAGRLDKDSSGLLLLTNDGDLLNDLTHPSKEKNKIYHIILNKPLSYSDEKIITNGVELSDGVSALGLKPLARNRFDWEVTMHEGRNRQIRRTFNALKYEVIALDRVVFGNYKLDRIPLGGFLKVS
jgi:23S rRNA pseudouridine2605 synthase